MSVISTPVTELFKIRHPILLAGMYSTPRSASTGQTNMGTRIRRDERCQRTRVGRSGDELWRSRCHRWTRLHSKGPQATGSSYLYRESLVGEMEPNRIPRF